METFEKQTVKQHVFYKQHLSKNSRAENVVQVIQDIVELHATGLQTAQVNATVGFQSSRVSFSSCFNTYLRIALGFGSSATIFPSLIRVFSMGSVLLPHWGHLGIGKSKS